MKIKQFLKRIALATIATGILSFPNLGQNQQSNPVYLERKTYPHSYFFNSSLLKYEKKNEKERMEDRAIGYFIDKSIFFFKDKELEGNIYISYDKSEENSLFYITVEGVNGGIGDTLMNNAEEFNNQIKEANKQLKNESKELVGINISLYRTASEEDREKIKEGLLDYVQKFDDSVKSSKKFNERLEQYPLLFTSANSQDNAFFGCFLDIFYQEVEKYLNEKMSGKYNFDDPDFKGPEKGLTTKLFPEMYYIEPKFRGNMDLISSVDEINKSKGMNGFRDLNFSEKEIVFVSDLSKFTNQPLLINIPSSIKSNMEGEEKLLKFVFYKKNEEIYIFRNMETIFNNQIVFMEAGPLFYYLYTKKPAEFNALLEKYYGNNPRCQNIVKDYVNSMNK